MMTRAYDAVAARTSRVRNTMPMRLMLSYCDVQGLLVNYKTLPDKLTESIMAQHFKRPISDDVAASMLTVAKKHSMV